MTMVDADWTITRSTGAIRYIGDDHNGAAPSYATVIEFHRWLQDFADDEVSSGDDEHDITDNTSSDRSTDNIITLNAPYNIDDGAAEHLYDGSIVQDGGDTIYDGVVNFGNATIIIQVNQDGAVLADDWWNYSEGGSHTGAADAAILTDSGQTWTNDEWIGHYILNTTDGSRALITDNDATTITGTLEGGTENDWDNGDTYLIADGLNADANAGISHRFMVKTRSDGVDIDGRRLIGINRTYNNTYGEFKINGTSRGNNVLALTDSTDLTNATSIDTVSGWTTITNTEGLRLIDISGDTVNEEYYSEWNRDTFTINQFYERMKWLSRDGSGSTLNGLNGELFRGLSFSFAYDGEVGGGPATNDEYAWGTALIYNNEAVSTFQVGEAIHEDTATPVWKARILAVDDDGVTGTLIVDVEEGAITTGDSFTAQTSGTTADANGTPTVVVGGGVLRFMAVDDDGTVGNLYGQLMKGTLPSDDIILYDDADAAKLLVVNGSVTERTISTPFIGQSTGSALIGAYGIGMEAADTSAADTFFDLQNNPITPPNNVTFTVFGVVSGEDRVLVANDNAGGIDFAQMSLNTTLAGGTETAVVVTAPIPDDTPSTGTIRIELDDGRQRRIAYTSYTGSTFTIASTDFLDPDDATAGNDVWVSYIDKLAGATSEAFTTVYDADRTLFIRVRDGGVTPIKTFETTGTLGSNGGSATAIRTPDA